MPGYSRTAVSDPAQRAAMLGEQLGQQYAQGTKTAAEQQLGYLRGVGAVDHNNRLKNDFNSLNPFRDSKTFVNNMRSIVNGANPLSLQTGLTPYHADVMDRLNGGARSGGGGGGGGRNGFTATVQPGAKNPQKMNYSGLTGALPQVKPGGIFNQNV